MTFLYNTTADSFRCQTQFVPSWSPPVGVRLSSAHVPYTAVCLLWMMPSGVFSGEGACAWAPISADRNFDDDIFCRFTNFFVF